MYKPAIFLFALFLCSCKEKKINIPVNKIAFRSGNEILHIDNWMILGKKIFSGIHKPDSLLSTDFLNEEAPAGDEQSVEESLQKRFQDNNRSISDSLSPFLYCPYEGLDIQSLFTSKFDAGVIYLACILDAENAGKVSFLVNACQSVKVWHNNTLIQAPGWKNTVTKNYEEYINLDLKKGRNYLVVKIVSSLPHAKTWRFNSFLSTRNFAKKSYLKDYRFDFIKRTILHSGNKINLYLGPYFDKGKDISYSLFDLHDSLLYNPSRQSLATDNLSSCIGLQVPDSLKGRLLRLKVSFGEEQTTFEEMVFLGNFTLFADSLINASKNILRGGSHFNQKRNFTSVIERMEYLDTINNNQLAPDCILNYWDRNRLAVAQELTGYLHSINGKFAGKNNSFFGFSRSYISEIDGSRQDYLLHIDPKLIMSGEKIPLIILPPLPSAPDAPFFKNWYTADQDRKQWDCKLADEYGFGIAWIDMRGNPGISSIADKDFFEFLKDAKTDFNIDENRIFVVGISASSLKAFLLAARHPDLFAGYALINPALSEDQVPVNNYLYFIGNLQNKFLLFKAALNDQTVPIEEAASFYQSIKSPYSGLVVDSLSTHTLCPKDYYKDIFAFFKGKARSRKTKSSDYSSFELKYNKSEWFKINRIEYGKKGELSGYLSGDSLVIKSDNVPDFEIQTDKIDFSSRKKIKLVVNDEIKAHEWIKEGEIIHVSQDGIYVGTHKTATIEGPINHFFTKSFVLIYNHESQKIAKHIQQEWESKYYYRCALINEDSLNEEILRTKNILLLGEKFSNNLLKRIYNTLPNAVFGKNSCTINGKTYSGARLASIMIYPNLLFSGNYILSLNYYTPELLEKTHFVLPNEFYHDYEIFEISPKKNEAIGFGNFDFYWK